MINISKLVLITIGTVLSVSTIGQTHPVNPFGLVYKGAITQNVQGAVQIHRVHYSLNGMAIAANVYTPKEYNTSKKYAAIVIAHPNGGVKEQVSSLNRQLEYMTKYRQELGDRIDLALWDHVHKTIPDSYDWPTLRIEKLIVEAIDEYI